MLRARGALPVLFWGLKLGAWFFTRFLCCIGLLFRSPAPPIGERRVGGAHRERRVGGGGRGIPRFMFCIGPMRILFRPPTSCRPGHWPFPFGAKGRRGGRFMFCIGPMRNPVSASNLVPPRPSPFSVPAPPFARFLLHPFSFFALFPSPPPFSAPFPSPPLFLLRHFPSPPPPFTISAPRSFSKTPLCFTFFHTCR